MNQNLDDLLEFHWMMDMLQTVDVGIVVLDKSFSVQVWNGFMESHSESPGIGAMEFAALMSGLVVTEQVFNLNGIGKWFVVSVENHDFTSTQTLVMLFALIFVVTNFVVDLIYAWLDPRIRYS